MKIPQYHFVRFPGTDGGTWWATANSKKRRKLNGFPITGLRPSPVPTVVLLFILCLCRGGGDVRRP
jgi:hypothetical protein